MAIQASAAAIRPASSSSSGLHLADQRLEEAEFFGFDHIQHLLLKRDPAVREVGLVGSAMGAIWRGRAR